MLASTSTASTTLLSSTRSEGLKHLYRTILQQARLLSCTLDDPIVFSSHRFLARKNLEPLLSSPPTSTEAQREWTPSTATKRIVRAQMHRRHLADANFGWEHSVHRALWLAYARKGKLRRDALSDLSPIASSSAKEQKYEKKLRKKVVSPVLQTLLTSAMSMSGAKVKSRDHLNGRPPPPFLPTEDDPLVKFFGKAVGRRRVLNANGRFVKAYLKKVLVPVDVVSSGDGGEGSLYAHLESKARPPKEHIACYPRRFGTVSRGTSDPVAKRNVERPSWLASATKNVQHYRSDFHSSAHRGRALRMHGWTSHPKDFSQPRLRRRLYARLLDDVPFLLLDSTANGQEGMARKNDPLGIRAKLETISSIECRTKMNVVKSRFAVGPRSRGAEIAPRELAQEKAVDGLSESEIAFLRREGLLS